MEILDQLIIRIIFIITVTAVLFGYKYLHLIFYPHARKQLFKRFYDNHNEAATIQLAGRILGFGIIYSHFDMQIERLLFNIADLLVLGISASILYVISVYILESITLYSFSYQQEIAKNKNNSYALISFANSVSLAIIIKAVMETSKTSLVLMITLVPLALIIVSLVSRSFSWYSKLPWKKLIVIKNMAIAIYYLGYMLGSSFIIYYTLNQQPFQNLFLYLFNLLIELVLIAIIFPLFSWIIQFIYNLKMSQTEEPSIGFGIISMVVFMSSSILTALIVARTNFAIYAFN